MKSTESPPPSGNRTSPPAREGTAGDEASSEVEQIVDRFLDQHRTHWPNESALPAPTLTLRTQAGELLKLSSATVALITELTERFMEGAVEREQTAPGSFKAYWNGYVDRIASHRTGTAGNSRRRQSEDERQTDVLIQQAFERYPEPETAKAEGDVTDG